MSPVGSFGLQWPLSAVVTQEFGHSGHPGIDIAAAYGSPIHAAGNGVVIYAGWEGGYGNYTCISHGGGISTCYGHQSAIYVSVGQTVTQSVYLQSWHRSVTTKVIGIPSCESGLASRHEIPAALR